MSTFDFFPPASFGPDGLGPWYRSELEAMGEPSLFVQRERSCWRAARFLWLRAFHPPLVARLDADSSGQALIYARTWRASQSRRDFELNGGLLFSEAESDEFWNLLNEADFWSLPSYDGSGDNTRDGAQWVLEVLEGERYHVVERWCLADGPLRRAALRLLELAEVRVQNVY